MHRAKDMGVAGSGWFYEVDYLPENNRVRYTISPRARKEVIVRLHGLNREYHEEELAAGLVDAAGKPVKRTKGKKRDSDDTLYKGTLF